ncbi:hypothetical protein GCM10025864_32280 [Luteimicrobium album]|uniref:PII-uridylyltransferase/Glutamine-synthetase adenylyltransferase domain-containing protein n=1 Tax=Luteimicrobium album TaxID=1054550 RepID=A0ABQ6I694_9MICO|nr:hypothetical protein [Luteimicrobium album]GMA25469.1 hypothetical protein GCM10025864_32280 [Luteimicrobium album]
MPIDALDRALRSVGRSLEDPTSDVDRWAGYRDLAWHVSTLHLAERAVLTEPDLSLRSTVLALLPEFRSHTQHRDLLERAGMADDTFLIARSRDITRLRELALAPSSLRTEDIDATSRWFQEHLVRLGVPEINRALAERGATKRVRVAAANHLDARERTS